MMIFGQKFKNGKQVGGLLLVGSKMPYNIKI
jgi:hypothetical protein